MNLASLREQIPALRHSIYLNTGTFGPSPTPVLEEVRRAFDLIEEHGPYSPIVRQTVEKGGYETTRSEVASFVGATADEIVLTRCVSDGVNIVAYGLDWQPDDEIVISNEEHQTGILPWLMLARRNGVKVHTAAVDPDPAVTLQNFKEQLSPRTRLVFASHVSGISGVRLPVCEISKMAHAGRALAIIDGAHALGQFPVNVRQIGCDAYIGCGHKWLLGPQGTGLAFIARERLETFKPSWTGWGAEEEFSLDLDSQTFTLHDSARRFEFGTKQWPLFLGLGAAVRLINQIGISNIQARSTQLAMELKQAIDGAPWLHRMTPAESALSTGIVSIRLDDSAPENLGELLWQQNRLLAAYWHPLRRLRLAVAFFNTREEIERAFEAVCRLTAPRQ